MKIIAIGVGQCGCNIADEFYAVNNYAKSFFNRRIEILTDAFAINTDETDLAGLKHIPQDKRHRVVIGAMRTLGHGVGKINFDAARIMKEIQSVVTDSVFNSRRFDESDGIVVIGSGGGGTGSGAIGWLIKGLKERVEKSIYAIVVLPFGYEEKGRASYAITNTATCLKMVNDYADAVFLLDNERFGRADISLSANFKRINQEMTMNFYDLFCTGEEKKQKYIGSKVIDAGDIKHSLEAISTVGRGVIDLSTFYSWKNGHYREAAKENIGAAGALDRAVNNLCLRINIEDARKILALVCAPKDVITLPVLEEISSILQEKSPEAVVRIGDYPRRGKQISVTLIISKLTRAARMENIFLQAQDIFKRQEQIKMDTMQKIDQMYKLSENLPSLEQFSLEEII